MDIECPNCSATAYLETLRHWIPKPVKCESCSAILHPKSKYGSLYRIAASLSVPIAMAIIHYRNAAYSHLIGSSIIAAYVVLYFIYTRSIYLEIEPSNNEED